MFCDEFFNKDAFYCKQFVIDQKRCFNCLSKKIMSKTISEFTCRQELFGTKHYTLLHEDINRFQIQILQ